MRFIVLGAGAVGGVVGGRLAQHGQDVILIARRSQCEAIREHGLRIETPDGATVIHVPVVEHPSDIRWRPDDVVLLTVKTQDTARALEDLAAAAPDISIVCMQNGVENERIALRRFANVYAVCVMCPSTYLTPGTVQAWASPTTGILDIGRYPSGIDGRAEAIAAALRASTFSSEPRADIMRWKYAKLLMNLSNSAGAICGPAARRGPLAEMTRAEGVACLRAAGIAFATESEDLARRGDLLKPGPTRHSEPSGGSSWQSLQRQAGSIESAFLNGEIVLLGRLYGIPTPVNELLQHLAIKLAREKSPPGAMSIEEVLSLLKFGDRPQFRANEFS
jgi:2-dehydropantoate 2-reductase